MPKGGGGLSCNLCWSELQAPFIVTSCGHAFCEKHKTDASLQASTCPLRLALVARRHAARQLRRQVDHRLDGAQRAAAELVLKIADRAVGFWVAQERNKTAAATHALNEADKRKEEYKQRCNTLYQQQEDELAHERRAKEQATAQSQEFEHELNALQDKYQARSGARGCSRRPSSSSSGGGWARARAPPAPAAATPTSSTTRPTRTSPTARAAAAPAPRRRTTRAARRRGCARPSAAARSVVEVAARVHPRPRPPAAGLDAPPVGGAARRTHRRRPGALRRRPRRRRPRRGRRPPWPRRRRRAQPRQHAAAPLELGLLGGGGAALRRRHPVRGGAHGPLVRRVDGRRPRLSVASVKRTRTRTDRVSTVAFK